MLEAVIFDMDGVIVDSEPFHREIEKGLFRDFGINISEEEHLSFAGMTSEQMWLSLKTKFNLPQSVTELKRLDTAKKFEYIRRMPEIKAVSGVVDLLKELSDFQVKLAIASSSPIEMIKIFMTRLELEKYFQKLISGEFVSRSKPEPEIFLYAAELLKVKPENCIVIEDSQNGVQAAKSARMKCVGYRNLGSGNQDLSLADLVIANFAKINYQKLLII